MKIHIIQLEPEDDHASARDKLSQAKATRAVLVWPRRGRPLARRLDLVVVARHARRKGIEIGLVSHDPEVLTHAAALGIPAFDSLEKLSTGDWAQPGGDLIAPPTRERKSLAEMREARAAAGAPSLRLPARARAVAFGVAIASILLLFALILPRAEVILQPVPSPLEERVAIWIDPDLENGPSEDRIPGRKIVVSSSGDERIETSSQVRLPHAGAAGEVTFTNLTDAAVLIPEGTGVRAAEVRFQTSEEAELEGKRGAAVTVPVMASQLGRSGNVAAGEIDAIEGELGFLLSVSNSAPTSGGQDVLSGAVSERDLSSVRTSLEAELLKQAEGTIRSQLSPAEQLAPGSLRIVKVVDERYDRASGAPAETLSLSLTLEVEGLSFRTADALAAVEAQIARDLSGPRLLIPGTLSIKPVPAEGTQTDGPSVLTLFELEGETTRQIPFARVRRSARGGPTDRIGEDLSKEFGLPEPPAIWTSPSWLPWLPWLEFRIGVYWPWETP